jgi:hypothetical protein
MVDFNIASKVTAKAPFFVFMSYSCVGYKPSVIAISILVFNYTSISDVIVNSGVKTISPAL